MQFQLAALHLGAFVYYGSSQLLLKLKIDDPLDASPVHFFCGMWGVLASGLFANKVGRCRLTPGCVRTE